MPPELTTQLFDADAHPILLDFSGTLERIHAERVLAISQSARQQFQDRFDLEVAGTRAITGMSRECAEAHADTVLAPLHRELERRRDEAIARQQEWLAEAIRNLLDWWQDTRWNPANHSA